MNDNTDNYSDLERSTALLEDDLKKELQRSIFKDMEELVERCLDFDAREKNKERKAIRKKGQHLSEDIKGLKSIIDEMVKDLKKIIDFLERDDLCKIDEDSNLRKHSLFIIIRIKCILDDINEQGPFLLGAETIQDFERIVRSIAYNIKKEQEIRADQDSIIEKYCKNIETEEFDKIDEQECIDKMMELLTQFGPSFNIDDIRRFFTLGEEGQSSNHGDKGFCCYKEVMFSSCSDGERSSSHKDNPGVLSDPKVIEMSRISAINSWVSR